MQSASMQLLSRQHSQVIHSIVSPGLMVVCRMGDPGINTHVQQRTQIFHDQQDTSLRGWKGGCQCSRKSADDSRAQESVITSDSKLESPMRLWGTFCIHDVRLEWNTHIGPQVYKGNEQD
ncbi:hypothetical protein AcW1_008520 [Taiwanofungus camphoratus]|nr:hypothetical protein AcW1_008520 [Antrodia cinnamomea]